MRDAFPPKRTVSITWYVYYTTYAKYSTSSSTGPLYRELRSPVAFGLATARIPIDELVEYLASPHKRLLNIWKKSSFLATINHAFAYCDLPNKTNQAKGCLLY